MGLAAAENKRKLGTDPNNTRWSRNTDTFGQKLLRAQGWEPGQYLGAKDAPHAEWHTKANTTHIQVTLKDDNLGLGAKRNSGNECTGLDAFQLLLGRLNGKAEDVLEAEKKAIEEVKIGRYLASKIGTIRFVKGGWLVGDQLTETPVEETEKPVETAATETSTSSDEEAPEPVSKKSRKRKAEDTTREDNEKPSKKDKKSKRRKTNEAGSDDEEVSSKHKKKKPRKHRTESEENESQREKEATSASEEEVDAAALDPKKARKERREKKAREKQEKQEKKEKKERRRREKASSGSGPETGGSKREKKRREDKDSTSTSEDLTKASPPVESGASTPIGSGYSTPVLGSARFLSRQRFIAQKRMAFADTVALNQIFMIKS
ncbi:protein PXR1 [Lasiosphaeria hispida]|uniref:PinX1-related protein 1 n=1 Tax=Lasiosphaeria hispida TaxID=260671 RepID=A0AAJ0HSV5_9PEZI|nr:protein PXR1 [Lasiosphaeria hispida]